MSQSINGIPNFNYLFTGYIPCFAKYTEVLNPGPSTCFVFLDVHENEILDTEFGIPLMQQAPGDYVWWDVPANRHNQGCNFAFAYGHAEHWKWQFPKSVTVPRGNIQAVNPAEMNDFLRMQTGFCQEFY